MPCSKARSTTSSGSTPTAIPTPPRSWTATAAWSPSLRSPVTRQAARRFCALLPSGRAKAPLLGVGGTGCYGAGLASFLADRGEWVVEIDRPKRPRGRTGAKSDPWTRSGPAGRRSAVSTWRRRGSVASGRRCGCYSSPEPASSRSAGTPAATSRRCWSPAPSRCGPGCGADLAPAGPSVRGTDRGPNGSGGVPGHRAGVAGHGRAGPGRPPGGQAARQGSWTRWPGRWRRRCWPSPVLARSPAPRCRSAGRIRDGCPRRPPSPCSPAPPPSRPPPGGWSATG
jgi:hypothetical protein